VLEGTDVTGALGFTPYNATNPNNYIDAAGAPVQSVVGATGAITASQIASAIGTLVSRNQSVATVSSATGVTLSAAEMVGGWILRTGAATGAITDTTDTAANLVSAYNASDTQVNSSFLMGINNTTGQVLTLAAGTGVTLSGTMTINPSNTRVFLGVFTDVTSGSQAVTLTSLFTAGV
jgi:hypothetical protein